MLFIDKLLSVVVTPLVLMDAHVPRNSVFIYQVNYTWPASGLRDDRLVVSASKLSALVVHLPERSG